MALTQDVKQELINEYGTNDKDTGNTVVQIAMLTRRINDLTQHLKDNPKDFACQRGLLMLVGKRRRLQNYFKQHSSQDEYKDLLKKLKLRK